TQVDRYTGSRSHADCLGYLSPCLPVYLCTCILDGGIMLRIGIVGCGRILNAHLQGFAHLRTCAVDTFRIAALCARRADDARMFRRRGEGPTPRPPVMDPATGDPLAAP